MGYLEGKEHKGSRGYEFFWISSRIFGSKLGFLIKSRSLYAYEDLEELDILQICKALCTSCTSLVSIYHKIIMFGWKQL